MRFRPREAFSYPEDMEAFREYRGEGWKPAGAVQALRHRALLGG